MSPLRIHKWPSSRLCRCARQWHQVAPQTAGLTLVECLAAIVVVGFIGAAIAPVLVISVATRVQSQRSEQALGIAQGEVDRVRVIMERGGDDSQNFALPPAVTGLASIGAALGPDSVTDDPASYDTTYTNARPVDVDPQNGNGFDYAVQVYRDPGQTVAGTDADGNAITVPVAFSLGVRVYEYQTVLNAGGNLDTQQAAIGLTSSQGDRSEKPLSTLYTTVAVGDDTQSLCNYIDYIDSTDPAISNPPKPLGCD